MASSRDFAGIALSARKRLARSRASAVNSSSGIPSNSAGRRPLRTHRPIPLRGEPVPKRTDQTCGDGRATTHSSPAGVQPLADRGWAGMSGNSGLWFRGRLLVSRGSLCGASVQDILSSAGGAPAVLPTLRVRCRRACAGSRYVSAQVASAAMKEAVDEPVGSPGALLPLMRPATVPFTRRRTRSAKLTS